MIESFALEKKDIIYFGEPSEYCVDTQLATPQLVMSNKIDFFVYNCLAVITIEILYTSARFGLSEFKV